MVAILRVVRASISPGCWRGTVATAGGVLPPMPPPPPTPALSTDGVQLQFSDAAYAPAERGVSHLAVRVLRRQLPPQQPQALLDALLDVQKMVRWTWQGRASRRGCDRCQWVLLMRAGELICPRIGAQITSLTAVSTELNKARRRKLDEEIATAIATPAAAGAVSRSGSDRGSPVAATTVARLRARASEEEKFLETRLLEVVRASVPTCVLVCLPVSLYSLKLFLCIAFHPTAPAASSLRRLRLHSSRPSTCASHPFRRAAPAHRFERFPQPIWQLYLKIPYPTFLTKSERWPVHLRQGRCRAPLPPSLLRLTLRMPF